jgi:hypothetical protein
MRIAYLLLARCPDAVLRRIALIVVDALNFKAPGRPHVGDEIREVIPSFTDGDTATSISSKMPLFRIHAALTHLRPDRMFSRALSAAGCAVFGHHIGTQASATPSVASRQIPRKDDRFSATRTSAAPRQACCDSFSGEGQHSETPEDPTSQVERAATARFCQWYILVSHAVSSSLGDVVARGCGSLATSRNSAAYYFTNNQVAV